MESSGVVVVLVYFVCLCVQVLSPELLHHSLRHNATRFLTSTVVVDLKTNEVCATLTDSKLF